MSRNICIFRDILLSLHRFLTCRHLHHAARRCLHRRVLGQARLSSRGARRCCNLGRHGRRNCRQNRSGIHHARADDRDVLRMKKGVERELNSLLPRPCFAKFRKKCCFFSTGGAFSKKCSTAWLLFLCAAGYCGRGNILTQASIRSETRRAARRQQADASIWQHLNANESLRHGSPDA